MAHPGKVGRCITLWCGIPDTSLRFTNFRRMPPSLMDLPADALHYIDDYLRSPLFSHVCHRAWMELQGKHFNHHARTLPFDQKLTTLKHIAVGWHTVCLDFAGKEAKTEELAELCVHAPSLHSLQMNLQKSQLGRGVCALFAHVVFQEK